MKRLLSIFLSCCLLLACMAVTAVPAIAEGQSSGGGIIRIIRNGEYLDNEYTDIPSACRAAVTGDTIELSEATYSLAPATAANSTMPYAVSLSKAITLKGPSGGYATITPTSDWQTINVASFTNSKLLILSGTAITVENIILDGLSLYSMDGIYTTCADLHLNNVIIKNFKRSCLGHGKAAVDAFTTTADGLYIYTSGSLGDSSYHQVDISGGTLIFNSGVICGTAATSSGSGYEGAIVNNAVNTMGPISYGTSKGYMSDAYAADKYPDLGFIYKAQVKSFIKNNAAAFQALSQRYATMSPCELSGTDPLGNVYTDTIEGLLTISDSVSNTTATASLNSAKTKAAAVKANNVNTLSTLSYSINGEPAIAVPGFDGTVGSYVITLPVNTQPTAKITLSGACSSTNGDVINIKPVTLKDGKGTASVDGWAYAASPQTKTYSVSFTVPKLTVNFAAGEHGSLASSEPISVFYGTAWSDITVPAVTADEGYKFSSWSADFPEAVTENLTYTASFSKDADQWATVTFSHGEHGTLAGITSFEVLKGTAWSDITVPAATADEGYKFSSWSADFPEAVTENLSYTASFSKDADQWATVTFSHGEHGTLAGITSFEVLKGTAWSDITVPAVTADEGYKFSSWSADFPEAVTENLTYTASFSKDADQWATVTFSHGEHGTLAGITSFEVIKGTAWSDITVPAVTADEGYKFSSWSADFPEAVTESVSFSAIYQLLPREVTLNTQDDIVQNPRIGDTPEIIIEYLIQIGSVSATDTIAITTSDGDAVANDAPLATGMVMTVNETDSYTIIVGGDVNGNAVVDEADCSAIVDAAMGKGNLSDEYFDAGDINHDGVIDVFDVFYINAYIDNSFNTAVLG